MTLRKELDCKLRQLVINTINTAENYNNDSSIEDIDKVTKKLTDEMNEIEDWIISRLK